MKKFLICRNFCIKKERISRKPQMKFVKFTEMMLSQFARFRSRNFVVKDVPRSGRLIVEKVDEIMKKIDQDRLVSSDDIAKDLNIHHQMVLNYLKKVDYKKKLDVWAPHELFVKNLMDRIYICDSLLKRNEMEPFLMQMVTGDEKLIKYDNNVRK